MDRRLALADAWGKAVGLDDEGISLHGWTGSNKSQSPFDALRLSEISLVIR